MSVWRSAYSPSTKCIQSFLPIPVGCTWNPHSPRPGRYRFFYLITLNMLPVLLKIWFFEEINAQDRYLSVCKQDCSLNIQKLAQMWGYLSITERKPTDQSNIFNGNIVQIWNYLRKIGLFFILFREYKRVTWRMKKYFNYFLK